MANESYNTMLEKMTKRENIKMLYGLAFFAVALIAVIVIPSMLLTNRQDIRQDASGPNQIFSNASPTPAAIDSTPPSISIIYPQQGSSVIANQTLDVQIIASDDVEIKTVQLFVNEIPYCNDTSLPFTCQIKVPATANSTIILRAQATDTVGNSSSNSISVIAR